MIRIYTILKHSSVDLNIFTWDIGTRIIEKLHSNELKLNDEENTLLKSYYSILDYINDQIFEDNPYSYLKKCQINNGKFFWLCEKHQSNRSIIILDEESENHGNMLSKEEAIINEVTLQLTRKKGVVMNLTLRGKFRGAELTVEAANQLKNRRESSCSQQGFSNNEEDPKKRTINDLKTKTYKIQACILS